MGLRYGIKVQVDGKNMVYITKHPTRPGRAILLDGKDQVVVHKSLIKIRRCNRKRGKKKGRKHVQS